MTTQPNQWGTNMNREYAEEQARAKSIQFPNEHFAAVFHTQVYRWIVIGGRAINAVLEGGQCSRSQVHAYLRGYCSTIEELSQPIDIAYVKDGELYCRSWIEHQAAEKGYEVIEERDDNDKIARIIVENQLGDDREVFELPNDFNYKPEVPYV